MKVTTLRLPEDLVEDLDEEYAEYGHGNRSEYVRWLLERRDRIRENTENTPSYSDRNTENTLADRFDDLEARLAALEQRLDTTGDREAADAPREPPEENPSGHHRDPPESLEDVGGPPERASDDDLVTAVRRYLSNRPPKTGHGKDALVDAFELLREHGTMKTGDLKTALFEAYSEHYGGERAMWESTSRYLDDVPGVEKGGYGEWTYAGDEAARDALGGSGGVYDPTEEFA